MLSDYDGSNDELLTYQNVINVHYFATVLFL